jgi:hypothetical protein
MALCKLAYEIHQAKCHVAYLFYNYHQICVICQYVVVLTPLGLHIQIYRL